MAESARPQEPSGPTVATRLTVAFSLPSSGKRAVLLAPPLQRGWLRSWASERGYAVAGETDDESHVDGLIRQCKADAVVVGPLHDGRSAVAAVAALRARLNDIEIVVPDIVPIAGEVDGLTAGSARLRIMELIEHGGIEPVFQPVFDLATNEIKGIEALSRFPEPDGRSASSWFDEAELVGLGQELEVAAIKAALAEISDLPKDWFVSVNMSSRTFAGSLFTGLLDDLSSGQVVVELTSQHWTDREQPLRRAMLRSRDARIRVAVDDVGATARSLVRAFELRPDIVKIDPSLVRGIDRSPSQQSVVGDLAAFAADASATLVAEGIERRAEIDVLLGLGVGLGQGYLLAPPMTLEHLRDFSARRPS
jgi:EAL domain-containing protein (putative c-di-GMP-specific phosphodiesterase class I)